MPSLLEPLHPHRSHKSQALRLGVNTRTKTTKVYSEVIGLCDHDLLHILGPIINIIGGLGWSLKKESLDFDNVLDIHVSFKNWKEKGYSLNVDLLITL